ncbi:MAG: CPBP family intramembrane glutamic endopeptidase [Rhodothermales bacterium]|nr:CPBP family intramembrane glutamic endopeptidase [Rhodothermales bacterium]
MIVDALTSALVNLVLLVGIPFGIYLLVRRRKEDVGVRDVLSDVGLKVGDPRYIAYGLIFALITVAAIVIRPPAAELSVREGSAFKIFDGLGFEGTTLTMALIYGVVKTGFAEEFLFRGLIAGALGRRLSMVWANVTQAAIFLLPHLLILAVAPEMWPILPIVFAGALVLGWLRFKSGSILGPWLVHAAANVAMAISIAVRTAG